MATSDLKFKISFAEFMKEKGHIDIDVCSLSTHQLYVKKQDKNLKRKELFCHRNLHSFFGQKKKGKGKRAKRNPAFSSYCTAVCFLCTGR